MYSDAFGWDILFLSIKSVLSNVLFKANVSLLVSVWMIYTLIKLGY